MLLLLAAAVGEKGFLSTAFPLARWEGTWNNDELFRLPLLDGCQDLIIPLPASPLETIHFWRLSAAELLSFTAQGEKPDY